MRGNPLDGFGLIVIGTEVLDGRREDAHVPYTRRLLTDWNIELAWCMTLRDEAALIASQLKWAFQRPEPFFCCGGIGATPDDLTRACAARALGVALAYHPQGVEMLKARFGADATPARLLMVHFPEGADLIPNPVNRVPGFTIRNGHFLPGFPSMAQPMMRWVLDRLYDAAPPRAVAALVLPDAREADLVLLMERFIAAHPDIGFSSLPAFTASGTSVHLGLKGLPAAVADALGALKAALDQAGVVWHEA